MQKEPHFLHEWGKADFSNITKSGFTSPSALGVVYRAVSTDRVVLVPVLGIRFGVLSLSVSTKSRHGSG